MKYLLLFCISLFGGEIVSPKLGYFVHDMYLQQMHSILPPLTDEEKITDWGKEYEIGLYFARELDLYQAITAFKRASIVIPKNLLPRRREIDYLIINAYYLGGQYASLTAFFDHSLLANIEPTFPAFHDLLLILYDSLENQKEKERALRMLKTMEKHFPFEKKKLDLGGAILSGDIDLIGKNLDDKSIETSIASLETSLDSSFFDEAQGLLGLQDLTHQQTEEQLQNFYALKDCKEATLQIYNEYKKGKKNPNLAGGLNALLPGLGYLYLGQKQSALTALLLNGLTAGAAIYFYRNDNLAAALLTMSFESGWYFGGIIGAKEEAKFFNTRTFETAAHYRMRDHKLYPILMLRHGF